MVEISDNLKAIYIDEGLEEPKLSSTVKDKTETKICDYCKEELLKDEHEQVLHDKDLTYTFCSDTCLKYFNQDNKGNLEFAFLCDYCQEKAVTIFEADEIPGNKFCCNGCIKKFKEKREKTKKYEEKVFPSGETIETLGEENEKLKFVNKECKQIIEKQVEENEKLKNERDYYKTYSEDFAQRIEELKRELHNEKIKSEAYKNNAEVILPDAEKIKSEARAELAEAKLKLTDLEKIVKEVRKFVDGALKLEVPGSPVYCLLRGMKEVLEVEKDENL